MLIQRCAWHAFFCGYPRPMRVLSWRGRGISLSDSICPSCAARVRIEGLWGSPPPPVWPGSPQTALLFVGVPLLTALVLLAAPLHDAAPLPPREETIAVTGRDMTELAPRRVETLTVVAATPRAVARRPPKEAAVPSVLRPRTDSRAAAASRLPAASLGTQSP